MSAERLLPAGFEELEPFVPRWALDKFQRRLDERARSAMTDIQTFYDAVSARVDDIFAALDGHALDALPPPEHRLYNLLMALAHVAHAVERHGQPRPANTNYPNTLRVIAGPTPG